MAKRAHDRSPIDEHQNHDHNQTHPTGLPAPTSSAAPLPPDPWPLTPDPRPLVLGANDEIIPAFERSIAPLAMAAKGGDEGARNLLYAVFEPKVARFVRRIRAPYAPPGSSAAWDAEDVRQEAFLVFAALVADWPPEIPFARYFLSHYPWRLRDAVYRGIARRGLPPRATAVTLDRALWLTDGSAAAEEARAQLEAIAAALPPPRGEILRRHVGDGDSLTAIATHLGLGRRTVTRHWAAIVATLRRTED